MVRARASPRRPWLHGVADFQRAGLDHAVVAEHLCLDFQRVFDREHAARRLHHAAVAGLAAGFGVEGRVVEHHHAEFAFVQLLDCAAVAVQREDVAFVRQRVVAVEGGRLHRCIPVRRRA